MSLFNWKEKSAVFIANLLLAFAIGYGIHQLWLHSKNIVFTQTWIDSLGNLHQQAWKSLPHGILSLFLALSIASFIITLNIFIYRIWTQAKIGKSSEDSYLQYFIDKWKSKPYVYYLIGILILNILIGTLSALLISNPILAIKVINTAAIGIVALAAILLIVLWSIIALILTGFIFQNSYYIPSDWTNGMFYYPILYIWSFVERSYHSEYLFIIGTITIFTLFIAITSVNIYFNLQDFIKNHDFSLNAVALAKHGNEIELNPYFAKEFAAAGVPSKYLPWDYERHRQNLTSKIHSIRTCEIVSTFATALELGMADEIKTLWNAATKQQKNQIIISYKPLLLACEYYNISIAQFFRNMGYSLNSEQLEQLSLDQHRIYATADLFTFLDSILKTFKFPKDLSNIVNNYIGYITPTNSDIRLQ